jgi:hypothetical protein
MLMWYFCTFWFLVIYLFIYLFIGTECSTAEVRHRRRPAYHWDVKARNAEAKKIFPKAFPTKLLIQV